jgi:GGDEF domain-containing protein
METGVVPDRKGQPAFALRENGLQALRRASPSITAADPMVAVFFRHTDVAPESKQMLLDVWEQNLTNAAGFSVFPWQTIRPDGTVPRAYDGPPAMWRPRETEWWMRDPIGFAQRITAPVATAEGLELLLELAAGDDPELARRAGALVQRILPLAEDQLARHLIALDVWRDTYALWVHVRLERVLDQLGALLLALVSRFGAPASRGDAVVGEPRHPWEGEPLVSATAHLGNATMATGLYPSLIPGLLHHVQLLRRRDGGWSDPDQPTDPLTTLAAAEFLSSVDPDFVPDPTIDFFAAHQEEAGWWRALGPEAPWLTAAVCDWLAIAELPFADRFRWPEVPRFTRDRKTGLPTYGHFSDLHRLFKGVPALADKRVELAFVDLIGFRGFNNALGQEMGDRCLRAFAAALAETAATRVIRDGGDEFLVVGAPTRSSLVDDLGTFMETWPAVLKGQFGSSVPPVRPRILVGHTQGRDLVPLRERLGTAIGELKGRGESGPFGILEELP